MTGVAIIGCGDMGRQHAQAWAKEDGVRIVAVADTDQKRVESLASTYDAQPFVDWREAIASAGVEVVSVCVPVCFHETVSVAACQAGRHVLCEKPMALSLEEADRMIAAADQAGVKLGISYQYRGHSRVETLRRLIAEGALEGPLFFRFVDCREVRPKLAMHSLSANGGPVHDMSGHFFDLVRYLTGAEAREVSASGQVFGATKPRLAGVTDCGLDTAEIQVRFDQGHSCSCFIHWGLPEGTPVISSVQVAGAKGVAVMTKQDVEFYDWKGRQTILGGENPVGPAVRIRDMLQAIATGTTPEVDGHAGRQALAISLAARRSVEADAPVQM